MEARQCRMCRPAHGETGRRERRTRVTTSPSIRSTATPTIKSKGCASAASWSCGAHAAKRRPRARPVDHRGLKSGIIATLDASPDDRRRESMTVIERFRLLHHRILAERLANVTKPLKIRPPASEKLSRLSAMCRMSANVTTPIQALESGALDGE